MEAVIFDLDDTLIVEQAVVRSAIAEALGPVAVVSAAGPVDVAIACAFSLALDGIGARAAGTVMVGDNWERDVRGAQQVGRGAVWLNHDRRPPEQRDDVLVVDEVTAAVFDAR